MKQFQFEIYDLKTLETDFAELEKYLESNRKTTLLFHIYSGVNDEKKSLEVRDYLKQRFWGCHIAGCLSNGEIFEGHLTDPEIVVTAWIFEECLVKVKRYCLEAGKEEETAAAIIADSEGAFLRGIELLAAKGEEEFHKILTALEVLEDTVSVFGGASLGHNTNEHLGFVLSGEGEACHHGIVAVFYYGRQLRIDLQSSLGWLPLGRELKVSKLIGNSLERLDDRPAREVYSHYLGIEVNDDFYKNVVEFPLMLERDGIWLLREPVEVNTDGGLMMVSDLFEGEKVRIAYADPENILAETDKACQKTREFAPEAIMLFSCASRKSFWSYFINKEMEPFQKLAPTSGFYSGGEVLRIGKKIVEQNVCMVVAGFREGAKKSFCEEDIHVDKSMLHGQLSLLRRLVAFAKATTEELEKANRKLKEYALIDDLTKLYNRRELERRLVETFYNSVQNDIEASFIMIDIDYFKNINDRYGHGVGDSVLREVADILREYAAMCGTEFGDSIAGRYGGEEFVLVLPGTERNKAINIAEDIRADVEKSKFKEEISVTVSIGVTSIDKEDRRNQDMMMVSRRVDQALYKAKNDGRNCVRVG